MKFPAEMQNHLIRFKEQRQYIPATNENNKWEYLEILDNLYPPIRHGFMQYAYESSVNFHDYARHVRSSQIFCFNLFYPLMMTDKTTPPFVSALLPITGEIETWDFEYQPQNDELGEWQGRNKPIDYITSVDFAITITNKKKERIAILIEVKFTEEDFTSCGGFKSNGNKNKEFCNGTFDTNKINADCYLVAKRGRKYFSLTNQVYNHLAGSICPFIQNNQCMRNHAFAKALTNKKVKDSAINQAYFGLVYHDSNTKILKEWETYKKLCKASERDLLFELKASEIVSTSTDETYKKYFSDRYKVKTY